MNTEGLCFCGCGRKTSVPKITNQKLNRLKGIPIKFIHGHNGRRFDEHSYKKINSGCWEWKGYKNYSGYGRIWINGKERRAHSYFYEKQKGKISKDLVLDHLCRNHACVNPDHLEPVTTRENIYRGISPASINAKKTHCKNGHLFSEKNTYKTHKGGRQCRICHKEYEKNRRNSHRN